jgi:hypothetical protein
MPERVVVIMGGQAQLLQVVAAPGAAGRLASGLHRRQEQRDKHADNRDDD